MAHLETPEAVDAPVNDDSAAAVMDKYLTSEYGEGEEELTGDEPDPEGDEPDSEDLDPEDADEGGDEPETAIEPPVSLNAEEKKAFAAASPEAQQAWAAAETRRNAQVQEATTKASEAQRTADARAANADAVAQQEAAKAILEVLQHYQPVEPQREWFHDDVTYLTACRQYDNESAQFAQRVQQAVSMEQQASQAVDQQFAEQREQELASLVPEFANPATRAEWSEKAIGMGRELGFDDTELSALNARGYKALGDVLGWKAKAERFDKAMSNKMQRVREGKTRTLRPGAAQPERSGREATNAITRLKQTGSDADALAAFTALGI